MPLPALAIGALAGGSLGSLGGFLTSKKKTGTSFNPEQQALSSTLGGYLNQAIGSGPSYYGGQMTSPFSAGEQANLDQFNGIRDQSGDTLSQLINLDDRSFNSRFQSEIADPTFRDFRTNVQPLIEESLPSFSIARGNVVGREAGNISDQLLQQRFAARESMKDRSLRAISGAESLYTTGQALNAVPREIQQSGLDKAYLDYVQGNEQYSKNIGNALSFLGISSKTQEPTTASNIFSGAIGGAGAGASLGSLYGQQSSLNKLISQLGVQQATPTSREQLLQQSLINRY